MFIVVFGGASSAVTAYLAIANPALLERRIHAGPWAETHRTQKLAMSVAMAGFVALLVVPALDRRFGWSAMPAGWSLAGEALILIGFWLVFLVFKENPYGASTVRVFEDHKVISSGPYSVVRHPMYAGALPMIVAIPLALGSWWGLLAVVPTILAFVWRLLDEERLLAANLPGYAEYMQRVRHRLVPYVW